MKPADTVSTTEKRDFAYELKFVLPETAADTVLAWASERLVPDPNANGNGAGGYVVNSLYFDTSDFDVYHRNGSYGRCKYRVRRYGDEATIFLERKLKTKGKVGKRRTRIADPEISFLGETTAAAQWSGYWFHRRLLARQLLPQCQISYQRSAWVGMNHDGPVRLTLDRDVRSFPTNDLCVAEEGSWKPILNGQCILELKFRTTLPELFQGLIAQLKIDPQPISKYRLTVKAFGWVPDAEPSSEATLNNGAPKQNTLLVGGSNNLHSPAQPSA